LAFGWHGVVGSANGHERQCSGKRRCETEQKELFHEEPPKDREQGSGVRGQKKRCYGEAVTDP
jgi:hypothetical protein